MAKKIIFLLIILSLTAGCGFSKKNHQPEQKNMQINKKLLMVIAPKDFRDEEYAVPKKIFEEKEIQVTTASIQEGEAIGSEGLKVIINLSISDVNPADYDGVVFVGGSGMAQITDDDSLKILAKKFFKAGKLTAAICVAPEILARAGILKGFKATAWEDSRQVLEKNGAEFILQPVVADKNIITANGPLAAKEFGEEIVKYVK